MNAQLSVISIHGGTITEDYLGRINICEFCGEEVIPNGNTRSVRTSRLNTVVAPAHPATWRRRPQAGMQGRKSASSRDPSTRSIDSRLASMTATDT